VKTLSGFNFTKVSHIFTKIEIDSISKFGIDCGEGIGDPTTTY
jgi:hypothetical protein